MRALAAALVGASALTLAAAPAAPAAPAAQARVAATPTAVGSARSGSATPVPPAKRKLGTPRSGQPWHSGAWTGGRLSAERTTHWGRWRGSATDLAQTYPERRTWAAIRNSTWHIDTYRGFRGKLMYGLPLLPSDGSASLADVAAGKHDAVFRKVARDLASRGRGDTIVRVGWEANGDWYPWSPTAATAGEFKGAFRRVATVFKDVSPRFVIDFDVSAGFALRGQSNRLDALTKLYPGDDVVDVIGVDTYDWNAVAATGNPSWRRSLHPAGSVGLGDVAAFARAHRKGLVVPEWGLAKRGAGGNGDNPFYIQAMRAFFMANRDILVAENYFNEPDRYIANSLWDRDPQNPRAAAQYRRLW